jgi:hypothetical protein
VIGTQIQRLDNILGWIKRTSQKGPLYAELIVINTKGILCLAERHTELMACVGGDAVLSAGEMNFFVILKKGTNWTF